MQQDKPLAGKTIAILVSNGFEEIQMTEPQRALLAAGATLKIVSTEQGLVNGWHDKSWGHYFAVDVPLSNALAADFDAVLIPGGERGIAKLSANPHTKRILRGFADAGKPIAALGDGPQLLALAERIQGRSVVASDASREILEAAGAKLADDSVLVEGNLITARDDLDMDAFKGAIVEHFTTVVASLAAAA
jgi:putative intracellular protease/amidase